MADKFDLPPAAYSVHQNEFDIRIGTRIEVLLDGAVQDHVTAYDCQEGWLTRHTTDPAGYVVLDAARERVLIERRTGVVTVRWIGANDA